MRGTPSVRTPSKRVTASLAGLAALALACGGCATGTVADQSANAPAPPTGSAEAADGPAYTPYVSATTASDTDGAGSPDTYDLAFVVADGGGCTPSWGGSAAADDAAVLARVAALTASGADVRVSFGGAAGTELARACGSARELADAYAEVLDAVGADKADFDVEGSTLTDEASVARRDRAIRLLQKSRDLDVTYTLPVMPAGLEASALALLDDAVTEGVTLSAVNVMAMNYSESRTGDMGQYAQRAARAAHTQLAKALGLGSAEAWKALHLTVMAGVNDVAGETFTLADASALRTFAGERGVGALSLWATFRDRACADTDTTGADDSCSGVEQEDGAFGEALGGE
ncbi:hydrolase [Streptomyces sp. NBC_00247]|uniref:hydrolase n=1 Tax=Streptomyces sp. NBC_00247 TaxID=2975689 RepID=UPI003FA78F2E